MNRLVNIKSAFQEARLRYTAIVLCIVTMMVFSCDHEKIDDQGELGEVGEATKSQAFTECECTELPTGKLVWDYPVKPGSEEWKKFKTYDEMLEATLIPEEFLFSLSTEDLTVICLEYPGLYNIYAFNSLDMGLDRLFNQFNGISELFKRENTSKELLKHYRAKFEDISILDGEEHSAEKGFYIVAVSALEALLSRYVSQNGEIESYREILQCLVAGYEKKLMYPDYSPGLWDRINFYARIHMILKISPQSIEKIPNGINNPIFSPHLNDKNTMDIINELSYQLIKR